MKIIFVRHGEEDSRYRGGWSDLDLIEEGVLQAKKLADHIKENADLYDIEKIISSDLKRAMSTAYYISRELEIPIIKNERLREINNGDLAGMLNEIALVKFPNLFFRTLDMNEKYPNGESPKDFYERIKGWFEEFVKVHQNDKGNILIVTHSGVINVIYHLVKNIKWNNKNSMFKANNCAIHILDMEDMIFIEENKCDYLLDT